MPDISLEQFEQLLDSKLSDFREHVDERLGKVHQDGLRIHERITRQSQGFHEDLTRLNNRLDLVAAQVAKVGDDVGAVRETLDEQSEDFDRIERQLTKHQDRLEQVEAKTTHLPSPPPGR